MKIEIFGVGCANCDKLFQNAQDALKSAGLDKETTVTKVDNIDTFMKMGVFTTPALVVDGNVESVGRVLTVEEILEKINKSSK